MRKLALPLVILLGAALSLSSCQKADDAVFGSRVRAYLLRHPEVLEEAINQLNVNQAKAAAEKSRLAIRDRRRDIERDSRDFVANPNGKITLTEFFDYNCTYCKAAAPRILALIRSNPDVRFVFKEMPINGVDSQRAAALQLAARDKGKYLQLYQAFYDVGGHLDEPGMLQALGALGIDPTATAQKALSPEIRQHLVDNAKLAQALGVEGTPNFIIGDQVIVGGDMDKILQAIDRARKA